MNRDKIVDMRLALVNWTTHAAPTDGRHPCFCSTPKANPMPFKIDAGAEWLDTPQRPVAYPDPV
ncbi:MULTISPECIES: hypothetical protein [Burkholderiaceae]|uniref:hypothetical protein n=1 Tax=Burkholderiaceae TaxID=119060 RepID=UPI00147A3C2A|nr:MULTISPECIES: hypothetical protein [Burkholderiaceae]MCG1019913.1 hypothetical protein [Mycetohabitans sp. B4]MCG1039468.1 hypothetical protein [Mycetohabitans sp. B7]